METGEIESSMARKGKSFWLEYSSSELFNFLYQICGDNALSTRDKMRIITSCGEKIEDMKEDQKEQIYKTYKSLKKLENKCHY